MALATDQFKKYWNTANLLRKNLDAAEYKHIVLGLVFLKYVSDSFEERGVELEDPFLEAKNYGRRCHNLLLHFRHDS
jgi:type I restriction enzyme M protein